MKTVVIIGAGPAGLSAAYELIKKSDIKPIIIELDNQVGGLAKTILHNGNRLDIGPHRFFSKNDRVNNFWQEILPLASNSTDSNKIFLQVNRLTRILFLNKFFNYPIDFSFNTLKNLGFFRIIKIGWSYFIIRLKPIKVEKSLADFFTNRFGKELYLTFFKDYTEKVWGVSCDQIPPDWGAQRIKSLSIMKALGHFLKKIFNLENSKTVETSLIESFLFPTLGAGQMYEELASKIIAGGGKIYFNQEVVGISTENNKVTGVTSRDANGTLQEFTADYVISTMPVKNLISSFKESVPTEVKAVAANLVYRDYIIIGLLLKKMITKEEIKDNWIYIQENGIKMGRLDIFNNFSSKMLADEKNVWLGTEYFCNEGDEFWNKSDSDIKDLALAELIKMKIVAASDLLDFKVVRTTKAYPSYFGSYGEFNKIKDFTEQFSNLFLIGRNGMHRYNNMDHSILSGLMAADNIINNISDKTSLWNINMEEEYHESKIENDAIIKENNN